MGDKIKKEYSKMKDKKIQFLKFALFLGLFVFSFFGARAANAATLYFSPSSGNFSVGNILTVNILVNTENATINNAEATLNFPSGLLEVVSFSKSGSIFSLWVEEPTFSNGAGTLSFNGGLPTPGFNGATGKVLSAIFRVKKAGSASLVFSSAAVRANDGYGTNVFRTGAQAIFNLISPSAAPPAATPAPSPAPAAPAIGAPAAPVVSSPTHPDQNKWYSATLAKLTWPVGSGITASRLLLSHVTDATPLVVYSPAVNSKEFIDLEDGIWYFHIQLRNASGWGSVAHFQLQIDTAPPEPLSIKFAEGKETDNPRPTVYFDTTDSLSGIDNYKIKIGEGDEFVLPAVTVQSNPYTLPLQAPGKRSILVQAFDRAGNFVTAAEEFIIKPIQSPTFTSYPQQIYTDEIFEAKGTTYPNSQVTVWLQREDDKPKSQIMKSDEKGNFNFVAEQKLKDGVYKLWAEVTDERGAKSYPSEQIILKAILPLQIRIGKIVIDYVTIIDTLITIVIGLSVLAFYSWYRIKLWRRRLKKETKEAEQKLHQAFSSLTKEVKKQVSKLDGQEGLSERESAIYNQLKKALDNSEEIVGKEIKDIEKELKK